MRCTWQHLPDDITGVDATPYWWQMCHQCSREGQAVCFLPGIFTWKPLVLGKSHLPFPSISAVQNRGGRETDPESERRAAV